MKNSEKIKKILDGGNEVKITFINTGISYDIKCECGCYFYAFEDDDIDEINLEIKPIYKKPNWKVGDIVDVSPDFVQMVFDEKKKKSIDRFNFVKKAKIIKIRNCYCEIRTNTGTILLEVPFWAISASI